MNIAAKILSFPVHVYRYAISPLTGPSCRFYPTCSAYALEALREHGALKGSYLTLRRLLRCHPLCKGGCDPVPLKQNEQGGEDG